MPRSGRVASVFPRPACSGKLHDLSEAGILKTHRQGRMVYYQANRDSPVFPDLRGLLLKTAGLVDVLAQTLKPVAAKVAAAFVYGSIAAGAEESDSDIDLMVIGRISPEDLALPLDCARSVIGRARWADIRTSSWQAADPAFARLSAYLDACRMKRNQCEYDFAGGVTDTEANALIESVNQFAVHAGAWIKARYPELS
jgi:Polymerase beta, Nucleotidyltransferase